MIALDTSIEEMNRLGLLSVRAMNVCRTGGLKTLENILNVDKIEFLKVRNCGRKTIVEIDTIIEKYSSLKSVAISEEVIEPSECDEAKTKYERLHPSISVNLKSWVLWRFSKLSVRAKNAFPQLANVSEAIIAVYSLTGINTLSVKNCGKKTSAEIGSFLADFKQYFEEATKDIDTISSIPEIDSRDKEIAEIGFKYPFLLSKECENIVDFIQQNDGVFPYLYIAKLYIMRSDNPRISIYRDYYGLNPSFCRHSLSEIGDNNNLSRERVRQLVSCSIPLPKRIQEGVRQYLGPLISNVIAFDCLLWNKIQRENLLEESYSQTALLVASLLDTHTVLQVDDDDKEYLVEKSITENVKVRNVLNNICRVIELRRTTIEQLDILQFIKSDRRLYHKNVDQLCVVYADFLKRKYSVDIEDNRIVTMLPNALDVSIAIENILEQKGVPMSLDELLDVFNQLHPANTIDSIAKFKPYILRNRRIKPKGKTRIYVLKEWKNHFTGTLTSYLEHILRSFNEPISLDDLVDFALEEFPNTNKKSVSSLIAMDKDGRFIMYEGEYVGLSENSILDFDLKERKIIKRQSFDTRFSDFKEFVITMKRLPMQTGSDEEQSLARWMVNVLKSNIDSTEEQLLSLQEFLDDNKALPQNGHEYNFKQMCDQIKVVVNQTFSLPNIEEHQSECQWLKKNIDKYTSYEDNRKSYFEDLLAYLKDFGFYIG